MLQDTATPSTMPPHAADGAFLVPTAPLSMDNQGACFQGVTHLDSKELVALRPASPDGSVPLVPASAASSGGLICGQADVQQGMNHLDHDHPDNLVQTAAAVVADSIADDLVEDALSYHNMATTCAVDAVVEQLVSEANCDAEAADATNHRREAAMAIDSILDQLVSDAVADDEAAQVKVVETVLDELVSNAVVGVDSAQVETLSDLKSSRTLDSVLEQVVSYVTAEAQAGSATVACKPVTVQRGVSGSSSKDLSMQSTAEAHQGVGSQPSYLQCEKASSSKSAAKQQVQQLRRGMELLSGTIYTELYQVLPISAWRMLA